MRSEILVFLSPYKTLMTLSIIILCLFFANQSHADDACPAGSSAAYGTVINVSDLHYYESYCSVSFCGGIDYPTSVSRHYGNYGPTGRLAVRCPAQCFQTCDDEPEKDNECPWGFSATNTGSCVDDNDCAIGSSMGIGGSCEPDDCSVGSYLGGSGCTTCPQGTDCYTDPIPDPDPDPDGGGGGGSVPNCDSYSSCRDIALEELNCKENDRDHFIYQYIGPDDYAAECETCDGPDYLLYDECQNGACDFGYNAQNNRCWTVACPHGDCIDPDADGAFDPDPLPTNQDNTDERLSEIITAINSVQDSIENNETPEKIEELKAGLLSELDSNKTAIVNQLEENKSSHNTNNDANTDRLISTLDQIEANTRDGNVVSDKDYTDLLNSLLKNSEDALCELNPRRAGCDIMSEVEVDAQSAANGIMSGLKNSGIYSSLSEFKDVSINVTAACPSSFRFQLSFIGTYTLDVCAVFEPVVPLLRGLFIAFWGLVSFRALTDA